MAWFSPLAPTPFDGVAPGTPEKPVEPEVDREAAIRSAQAEASRCGWSAPPGAVFYSPDYGIGFFEPGHGHGDGGLGNPWLYFAGADGRLVSAQVPGTGSAGDIFLQAQFPLHSGRIFGVAGRVIVSLMGLVVAMFSVTGVVIWAKKRRARRRAEELAGVLGPLVPVSPVLQE